MINLISTKISRNSQKYLSQKEILSSYSKVTFFALFILITTLANAETFSVTYNACIRYL